MGDKSSEISSIMSCWCAAISFFAFLKRSEEFWTGLQWLIWSHLILWDSACRKYILLNPVDLPFTITAVFKNGLFMWRKVSEVELLCKACCFLASQTYTKRCEMSCMLLWVSFRFLVFSCALSLPNTWYKEGRLNLSFSKGRQCANLELIATWNVLWWLMAASALTVQWLGYLALLSCSLLTKAVLPLLIQILKK